MRNAKPKTSQKNHQSLRARFLKLSGPLQVAIIGGLFTVSAAIAGPFVAAMVPKLISVVEEWIGPPAGNVKIIRLLPDPEGDERENEEATIRNFSTEPVNLQGWKLRDKKDRTWSLDQLGMLAPAGQPGDQKAIKRGRQDMGMNNGGDIIELVDSTGRTVHKVAYAQVKEREAVVP
jgi:hypothetical protein